MTTGPEALPRETFRDWRNEFWHDVKFRYMPFRAYYRIRAYRYMLWKSPEMGLLRFLTHKGKVSLDIGANLGLFTYFLSRLSSHVYAFEPNPFPLRALRAVAGSNVTVLPIAVSDRSGEAELVVPRTAKGWSNNGASLTKPADALAGRLTVECRAIDDLDYRNVGFIKIDIEGHELAALKGAEQTLKRERPNLFIENERLHAGSGADDVFDYLKSLDYAGFTLIDGVLTTLEHFSFEEHQARRDGPARDYVKNFIFLPG
ncbi:MAG TPA: FkbM family methyltransferase [Gammaproteobacteria bacterium]|nr:FkbM family methyltransferase [Gammaproteobacteria bacterium]